MESLFYALAVLACPVAMGLMMFMMMRGNNNGQASEAQSADGSEIDALRAEIEALKAERSDPAKQHALRAQVIRAGGTPSAESRDGLDQ
jgi:hypothetical protein